MPGFGSFEDVGAWQQFAAAVNTISRIATAFAILMRYGAHAYSAEPVATTPEFIDQFTDRGRVKKVSPKHLYFTGFINCS
jgi:hypothetical protein